MIVLEHRGPAEISLGVISARKINTSIYPVDLDVRLGQHLDRRQAELDSTEDEVFVTAKAAGEGVQVENTGTEPLVSLRYFGPDAQPDAPSVGDHKK